MRRPKRGSGAGDCNKELCWFDWGFGVVDPVNLISDGYDNWAPGEPGTDLGFVYMESATGEWFVSENTVRDAFFCEWAE